MKKVPYSFIERSRSTIFELFLSAFPFNQGLPQRMMLFHSVRFPMSVSLAPTFPISPLTTSRNLFFELPLFLFPGNFISITILLLYYWSLFMTCPYYLSLPSLIFISNRSTLTVLLIYSFLILSFLVTLIANLNIFISATSISSTCFFVTAPMLQENVNPTL